MTRRIPAEQVDEVDAIVAQWASAAPDLDTHAMELFGRVYRCAMAAGEAMERTYSRHGITRADFDVLATLRRSAPPHTVSPGQLCSSMMLSSGGMTRRLDRLERLGLISREPDPVDRRALLVALTEEGRDTVDRALRAGIITQEHLLAGLDASQRRVVNDSLRQLLRSVRSYDG